MTKGPTLPPDSQNDSDSAGQDAGHRPEISVISGSKEQRTNGWTPGQSKPATHLSTVSQDREGKPAKPVAVQNGEASAQEHNCTASAPGNDDDDARRQLSRLLQEHRDLDAAIDALYQTGRADHLQVQRLKKRKLALKDRIGDLEDQLLPDIIA